MIGGGGGRGRRGGRGGKGKESLKSVRDTEFYTQGQFELIAGAEITHRETSHKLTLPTIATCCLFVPDKHLQIMYWSER